MHNLQSNFDKILGITKKIFANEVNGLGNFQLYPRTPKSSDLTIIALSVSADAIGIDSESYLYGKLKADYADLFQTLPDRCNYNRRKRRLREKVDLLSARVAELITVEGEACLIDSMPLPVCRMARASRLKILK